MDLKETALKDYNELQKAINEKQAELKELTDKCRPIKTLLEDIGALPKKTRQR